MKKLILALSLLFLSTISIPAQYLTTEKILFLTSTTIASSLSGWTEGLQQREQYYEQDPIKKLTLNRTWHITQVAERVSWITTGIAIALDADFNFGKTVSDLFVTGGIHWILYDGFENSLRGMPFFAVSEWQKQHNTSLTDMFASWGFKVLFLIVTIGANYIIYEL